MNTSCSPSSEETKPNPLSGLYHFTTPSTLVAVEGSGRVRPVDARGGGRVTCEDFSAAAKADRWTRSRRGNDTALWLWVGAVIQTN